MTEKPENITPPPGDCWNPRRLLDYNCEGCRYQESCTHQKKGKRNGNRRRKKVDKLIGVLAIALWFTVTYMMGRCF